MTRALRVAWLFLGVCSLLRAESKPPRPASKEEYRQTLARLDGLVASCRTAPATCDSAQVGEDQSVDAGRFEARFDWLRITLAEAKDAHQPDRLGRLDAASVRLADEAVDLATPPPALDNIPSKANEILNRPEFRHTPTDTIWQRWLAAFYLWLNQIFAGTGSWLPRSAWFVPALEWSILAVAAAGLLLWAWRGARQERLRVLGHHTPTAAWLQESDDWAARAEAEAARADWREAVHSLYWSAIVMLESQRLWAQNRARTPREYITLLEPNSERRVHLSGLTSIFERLWYGLRPAVRHDFEQAKALRDAMRTS